MSFCHKLRFSNSYNLATRFPTLLIFQTLNSGPGISNSLSLKYQKFSQSVSEFNEFEPRLKSAKNRFQ